MKSATVTLKPRIRAARKQSYVACPRPRPVHRPMAVWAAPVRRHIIGPVALLAVGFVVATILIAAIGA